MTITQAFLIIAISVIISTIVNAIIMRQVTEIAAIEIAKIEKRWADLIEKLFDK